MSLEECLCARTSANPLSCPILFPCLGEFFPQRAAVLTVACFQVGLLGPSQLLGQTPRTFDMQLVYTQQSCLFSELIIQLECIEKPFLAVQVVGDEDLAAKFEESALTIRRDIIFAASLYI